MSLSAWEVLGIAETTDLKSIRRAYAVALKQNRPEEDASAFQLLTDAYEWALAQARRKAFEEQTEAQPQTSGATDTTATSIPPESNAAVGVLPELGRPVADRDGADQDHATAGDTQTATATAAANEASDDRSEAATNDDPGFAFGPFFGELAEQLRKSNPLHLKEWLESHPDLYSLELKWALMPHVFDTLAHNAAELEPHNGHLETLMGFFGVDARLRRHPALAPALDYLESGHWRVKQAPAQSASPMPPGWENVGELLDDGNKLQGHRPSSAHGQGNSLGLPGWVIPVGIFVLFALARLVSAG